MPDETALPTPVTDETVNLDAPQGTTPEEKPAGAKPEGEQEAPKSDATEGEAGDGQPEDDDDDGAGNAADGERGLSRSQRRRLQLQRERERADRLERELAAERSRGRDTAPTSEDAIKAEVEKRVGKEPKREDFADIFEYERKATSWEAAARVVEVQVREEGRAAQASREAARQQTVRDHLERVESARTEIPDFDQVVEAAKFKVHAEPHVEELILTSTDGGRLLYHLLKDPKQVARLNALSPMDAAREMGRIEASLQRPTTPRSTKAPAPITPPKGGAAPPVRSPEEIDDMNEYAAARAKQGYGRRRAP